MQGAVVKFYLRKNIDDRRVHEILRYVQDCGHGCASVEHINREVIFYLYDQRDIALVKKEFGRLIDAEADLTR